MRRSFLFEKTHGPLEKGPCRPRPPPHVPRSRPAPRCPAPPLPSSHANVREGKARAAREKTKKKEVRDDGAACERKIKKTHPAFVA